MAVDTTEQKTGNQFYLAYKKGKQFIDRLLNRPAEDVTKKQPAVKECVIEQKSDEDTIKWPLPGKK